MIRNWGRFDMDIDKEIKNIKDASLFATISGVLTLILAIINPQFIRASFDQGSMIIEGVIILLLTFGLYKKSRICATILIIIFILESISKIALNMSSSMMLIITYFVFRGFISTYKYHMYKKQIQFDENSNENVENSSHIEPGAILLIAIIAVIIIIISGAILKIISDNTTGPFTQTLNQFIVDINSGLPEFVDEETRLDSVTLVSAKNISFNYTIVNYLKKDVDAKKFQLLLRPGILDVIKNQKQLEELRGNKITFTYSYVDKNNAFLFNIVITPEDYKK
jgi:hypothetical protein